MKAKERVQSVLCTDFCPGLTLDDMQVWRYYSLLESCKFKVSAIFAMPNHEDSSTRHLPSGSVLFFDTDTPLRKEAFGGAGNSRLFETTMLFKILDSKQNVLSNKLLLSKFNSLIRTEGQCSSYHDETEEQSCICMATRGLSFQTSGEQEQYMGFDDPFHYVNSEQEWEHLRDHILTKQDEHPFCSKLSSKGSHVSILSSDSGDLYLSVNVSAERSSMELMCIIEHYATQNPTLTISQFLQRYPYVKMHEHNTQRLAKHIAYETACYLGLYIESEYDSMALPRFDNQVRPRMGVPCFVQTANTMMLLPYLKNVHNYKEYVSRLASSTNISHSETVKLFECPDKEHLRPVFFNMCCCNPIYHPWHLQQDCIKCPSNPLWHSKGYTLARLDMSEGQNTLEAISKKTYDSYSKRLIHSNAFVKNFLMAGKKGPIVQRFITFTGPHTNPVLTERVHDDIGYIDALYTAYNSTENAPMNSKRKLLCVPDNPPFIAYPCYVMKKLTGQESRITACKSKSPIRKIAEASTPLPVSNVRSKFIGSSAKYQEQDDDNKPVQSPDEDQDLIVISGKPISSDCVHLWSDNAQIPEADKYESFDAVHKDALCIMGFASPSITSIKFGKSTLQFCDKLLSKHGGL